MIGILCLVCLLAFPFLWLPGAAAQVKGPEAKPVYGGSYRRPLANNPSTLDPHLITDTYGRTVAQQLFDGLVQYDGSLTIIPAIAESWQGSRDGLSWTFSLRRGVKFHNGREVVADDVVYSFTRILDPRTKSGAAEFFMKLKGAKEFEEGQATTVRGLQALDRYTVQVELAEASAPFVSTLAIGYAKILPREVVASSGSAFGNQPVGPHPNAAKVFLNWSLSKDGQTALTKALGQPTRRFDVDTKWTREFGHTAAKEILTPEKFDELENGSEEVVIKYRKPAMQSAEKLFR